MEIIVEQYCAVTKKYVYVNVPQCLLTNWELFSRELLQVCCQSPQQWSPVNAPPLNPTQCRRHSSINKRLS